MDRRCQAISPIELYIFLKGKREDRGSGQTMIHRLAAVRLTKMKIKGNWPVTGQSGFAMGGKNWQNERIKHYGVFKNNVNI